jgi:hypothetical protein
VERIDKTLGEVTYSNQKSYDDSGNCIVEYEKNILDRETNKIERKFNGEGLLEEELKINILTAFVVGRCPQARPGESYYTRYKYEK